MDRSFWKQAATTLKDSVAALLSVVELIDLLGIYGDTRTRNNNDPGCREGQQFVQAKRLARRIKNDVEVRGTVKVLVLCSIL